MIIYNIFYRLILNKLFNKININIIYMDIYKCVLIGDSAVGKTCILERLTQNRYSESRELTIGVDFGSTYLGNEPNRKKLLIWDTAGQERYKALVRAYYRTAMIYIFVYDIGNLESFNNIKDWLELANEHKDHHKNKLFVLIGNKSDLHPYTIKVERKIAKKFAEENNMLLFDEVSAASGNNIKLFFEQITNYYTKNFMELHEICLKDKSNQMKFNGVYENISKKSYFNKCC
jgi:small GTP-binding protein